MDTKISMEGDLEKDERGNICRIAGNDELKQRLYIRLSARKGGFLYDKELGSGIGAIDINAADAVLQIEAQARAALSDIPEAEVTGAAVSEDDVTVFVSCQGEEFSVNIRRGNEIE